MAEDTGWSISPHGFSLNAPECTAAAGQVSIQGAAQTFSWLGKPQCSCSRYISMATLALCLWKALWEILEMTEAGGGERIHHKITCDIYLNMSEDNNARGWNLPLIVCSWLVYYSSQTHSVPILDDTASHSCCLQSHCLGVWWCSQNTVALMYVLLLFQCK